jgi:hypothetical protein
MQCAVIGICKKCNRIQKAHTTEIIQIPISLLSTQMEEQKKIISKGDMPWRLSTASKNKGTLHIKYIIN